MAKKPHAKKSVPIASDRATIASLFARDDGARQDNLNTARICAQFTKPYILPFQSLPPDTQGDVEQELQENYQSLGAFGVGIVAGKMLNGFFPPMLPWFKLNPAAHILYDPRINPLALEQVKKLLFLRELLVQAYMDSAGTRSEFRGRQTGFRSSALRSILRLLVTGDTLEKMDDDGRTRSFRRDMYVTARDSCCDALYHITKEEIDALSLSPKLLEKAKIDKDEYAEKRPDERQISLYTYICYQPQTRKWTVTQEVNEQEINTSDETVSQYFSTPYEIVEGENYGRGFVENNLGDLRSLDKLTERQLDWAGMASHMHMFINETSSVRAKDIDPNVNPTGSIGRATVKGGIVDDIGFMTMAGKMADFSVVEQTVARIENRVGKIFLLGSESVRNSERTTAFEIQKTTLSELESATGGLSTQVADYMQVPRLHRAMFQLERGNWDEGKQRWNPKVAALPKNAVDLEILTGINALVKSKLADELLNAANVAKMLGPDALAKINMGVFMDTYFRYRQIYEPAMLKSNEQVAAERQAAQEQAIKMAAAEQAIASAGAVAESHFSKGGQPAPQ